MNKSISNGIIQVTGYNKDKEIIEGLLKGKEDTPISMVFSKYSKGRNFVQTFIDENKGGYVPIGSFIHARFLKKLTDKSEFYAAASASVLTKPDSGLNAYVAPVKVDADYTVLRKANSANKGFKALFASVLDQDFTSIRKLSDLESTLLSLLHESSPMGAKAERGALLRIGYTRANGEKKTIPVEFIPPYNVPLEVSVKHFIKTSKELKKALNVAKDALTSTQGLFEVSGLSRVLINDYGNIENVQKYKNHKAFINPANKKQGDSYALASIVVNRANSALIKLNVFDSKLSNPAGTVGVHGHDKNAFYSVEYKTKAQQQTINQQFKYPLRHKEVISSSGKRSGIAIEGDVNKLAVYKERIESAVSGITPIKITNTNQYIFPIGEKEQVLSSLSDLLGTPAIYTQNVTSEGKYKNSFVISGHTDKPFFQKELLRVAGGYEHSVLNGDFYFRKEDRIAVEGDLKVLLSKPLLPSTGRTQAPRISYAQWVEDNYRGNGDQIVNDLYSEIESVADKMGIDWSATSSNIIIPSPGSKPVLFKGDNNVKTDLKGHKGSAAVLASSNFMPFENKSTGKTENLLTVTIKFFNKKLNSGEGEATFNSFHGLLDKYNLSVGRGNTNNHQKRSKELDEKFEQKALENKRRLENKRKEDAKLLEQSRTETLRLWEGAGKEDGTHAQLTKKKLSSAIELAELKRVHGRNPFFMFAIYDMQDEFAGIQKIYATPWDAGKGKMMNKVYSSNIPFSNPETGENNGLHGRIGHDDGKSTIYVGEGFANTLTAVYLKGGYGVVGLTKSNAEIVISMLRNKYPDREIVQVADNDMYNPNGNVGVLSAVDSAWNSKINYTVPDFSSLPNAETLNDISDLYVHGGAKLAKQQLGEVLEPPKDLLKYHALRLKYISNKKRQDALETAVNEISKVMAEEDIEKIAPNGLEDYLSSHSVVPTPKNKADEKNTSTLTNQTRTDKKNQVEQNTPNSYAEPTPAPVQQPQKQMKSGLEIIEKVSAKSNSPYLLVLSYDEESKTEIAKACEKLSGGREPTYNQKLNGFIVPHYHKNPLAALLHSKTGSPQLYFGKPYSSSSKGFVIRGDIDNAARDLISSQLREIEHHYSSKEHGVVVSDIHALTLLKPVLRKYTERASQPAYFNPSVPHIPKEMMSDITFLSKRLNVPRNHIIKAQALIKSFNKNVANDNYMMATFYAKNAPNFSHLQGTEKHKAILIASIDDAFSAENLHLFETTPDIVKYAKALMQTAEDLGVIPSEEEEIEAPAAEPIEAPVSEPIEAPVSEQVEAPVYEPAEAPVSEPAEAPAAEPIEAPAAEPIEAPAAESIEATDKKISGSIQNYLSIPVSSKQPTLTAIDSSKQADVVEPPVRPQDDEKPIHKELENQAVEEPAPKREEAPEISDEEAMLASMVEMELPEEYSPDLASSTVLENTADHEPTTDSREKNSPRNNPFIMGDLFTLQEGPEDGLLVNDDTTTVEVEKAVEVEKKGEDQVAVEDDETEVLGSAQDLLNDADFKDEPFGFLDFSEDLDTTIAATEMVELDTTYESLASDEKPLLFTDSDAEQVKRLNSLLEYMQTFSEAGYTPDEFERECINNKGMPYFVDEEGIDKVTLNSDIAYSKSLGGKILPRNIIDIYVNIYKQDAAKRMDSAESFTQSYFLTKGNSTLKTFSQYFRGLKELKELPSGHAYLQEEEYLKDLFESDLEYIHHTTMLSKFYSIMQLQAFGNEEVINADIESLSSVIEQAQNTKLFDDSALVIVKEDPTVLLVISNTTDNTPLIQATRVKDPKKLTSIEAFNELVVEKYSADIVRSDNGKSLYKCTFKAFGTVYLLNKSDSWLASTNYNDLSVRYGVVPGQTQPKFNELQTIRKPTKTANQVFVTAEVNENAFAEFLGIVRNSVDLELTYREFSDYYLSNDKECPTPYHDSATGKLNIEQLRKALKDNNYSSARALFNHISNEQSISNQVKSSEITSALPAEINIMEPLSTSISGLGILKKPEIKQNDIVPFEQFISTPAALDGIHNIQKVAYKKLGDKAHIDAFSINAFKLYAEIHQVGGTAGINSKTELAQKIINNLTARTQIQLLDVGSLASMEEEQLLSLCSEVGIDSFTNPEFTAKKLKDVTTNIAQKNILKVAQLNYIATVAQGQEEGLDISNRILREVSAISGGTLSQFSDAVEQQMKLVEADKELSAVADSIQSNMILGLEERVELKALDFDEPIIIGIDNPKYVSRGRFQYAMTQGGTSERLILPTEIRYYSIISDQCIGVNSPIDNSFLAKYNLAPYNKEALEYSLAPFDDYLQKHGLIGAVDESENNIVITKTKDRYTVYNVKSGETTIEEFRTLTALADSVLSQPIVFDSIDFTTLTMKLEEYHELNTALQYVSNISVLSNDDLTKHLSKYIDASGLTRKEKESALRHAYVSDLSSTYRQSLIEQNPPAISIQTEELANALNSLVQRNESAPIELAPSDLSPGDRILSNEANTSGRILEMDETTTTIVPDWLFEARNSGSQIMRSIDLEFFNDISANSFAKIAPASMLTTDITQKFNPLEADGIENIKSASEEELSELAHLLSVNATDSLIEKRNGVIAALNARVAAFEVLNGSTSIEQAKEALEHFCTPCQTQDDIKAWLLKETGEASKRVQSLHFVELLNECEKFGYAKQVINVTKLSTQSLELASKVETLEGTTLVNKNHPDYPYWSQMLNQDDPLLIEVAIDQYGYSEIQVVAMRDQESVEENQVEVGYDEGQGLIVYHEDSYQIVSATGQLQENGNVEFVTGLETHLVSNDLVISFEQEKLDSMGAKLGLGDNQSFVTSLSTAQERSSNLTYPDTAYASLVVDALAAGIQLHSQNKELKVSEHDLGRHGEQYAYYNSQGAAVASGKTIEDAQAELITKLIEVENEISAVSERNTDSVQSDDAGPLHSAGATGSSQSRSRGNVINNGEGIRESSSENSAKAIGRNTESERLYSNERNASESKGRSNSNSSTNSDGKTRTKVYDFTKQQALTDDSVSNSVKFQYNVSAIRVLKLLEQEERQPTSDEIETLGLYSGWGGLGKDIESYQHVQLNDELKGLVSDDEYREIKASALTAFYTPVPVVQGVWKSLEHMGFEGGRVYDPSMGLGNFFGLMPEHLAANSKLAGGELDTITAGIARFLQSDVIVKNTGFEKSLLPTDYFDVMTSNIPFGNFKIHDPAYNKHNLNIHNYFIAKSLDTIKPGGVVAYITTTYTMDSQSTKARELFYKSSDLVSAIRLPNDVFKKHAGTNVNADLLVFRKRHDHEPAGDESWIDAFHYNKSMFPKLHYNNYFRNNPQNVMGELKAVSGQFGPSLANYTDENFETAFDRIVSTLPTNVFDSLNQNDSKVVSGEMKAPPPTVALPLDDQDEGSLVVVKDEIYMVEKRWDSEQEDHVPALIEFDYTQSKKARLVALIELKQAVREHLNVQIRNLPLASFEESKAKLNDKYDTFFKEYGPVNNRNNISLIKADTQAPLLMALDSVNTETGENQKADIFTERTVNVTPYPTEVNSVEDAIELSVARNGAVNMDFIGQLVDKSNESIYEESENLFIDPETGGYVHGSRYLSGNLADKLARAEHAVSLGENQFNKNIAALKAAFPKPLSYGDIKFQLGSSWMPKDYIRQFIFHIATGKDADSENDLKSITVSKCADLWDISLNWSFESKHQAKLENEWAGGGISAQKLLVKIANGDKIEVAQTIDGKRTVLIEATQQARQAAEDLKNEYFEWVGNSPERRQHVASLYNSTINVIAQPKYNAEHLKFTQLNPLFNNKKFEPRKKQREAVVRYKVDGTALLAHGVGSGKSFELCAMAREGKIAGVHNKAMISVPNNVFGQFARMFQQHYPSAKVLSIDSASLNAVGRKAMTARIALNNWDAVIVPHSFLSKISAPPEFIINQIRDQASELRNAMDIAEGIGSYNLKRSEKRLKSLEAKIEKRLNQESKDDLLYISDLGIDALMIDESDNFLNLPTPSNMSHVSGVNTSESNRAMNLLFIARYLQEKNDGKGLVMATGTDIRKSMSDMYVNMYYLMPQELRKMGLLSFDSFMSTFGEVITAIEASPEGTGYRENSRLAKFNNLPELGQLYRMVADVVTTDESGAQREKAEKIAVQASGGEFFKAYMDNIARRAQNFRNGNPYDEAWFSIQSSAQRAAFDLRMIDSRIPEAKDCKINLCAKNIIDVLKSDTSDIPVTQLVFIDRYVNPTDDGFSPYDTLIDKLVAGGIPRDKIITSREVVTEPQKKAFQDNMNAGNYLVAIGTTEKFGVGNNIQKYLKAMHELTPPWNPREIEQRSGRIERSGNLQTDLKMFRYSTENSFDLFQWEHIRRKALYIAQTKTNPALAPRTYVEEVDANFEEMMSIATANPLIKEKIDLDKAIDALSREKRMLQDKQTSAIYTIEEAKNSISRYERIIKDCETAVETMKSHPDSIDLSGAFVDDTEKVEKAFKLARATAEKKNEDTFVFGNYKGLEIIVDIIFNGPKKMPTLQGSTIINGHERPVIDTYYTTAFASRLIKLQDTFTETVHDSKEAIERANSKIVNFEPLSKLTFEKEEELSACKERYTELQTELVEMANNMNEVDSADWSEIVAQLGGGRQEPDGPSLMDLMD
ncbi:hypothetical protein [Paraglaciecola chathamensis]|uniref:N-6 DNA methylase n=1 Tax=Paraglaciecola agarilytica NO2 TaxID=1125747 RepID=A0ABQ0I1V2_9ALTE|nr:hypothetical protein [Paraglaciecola agarilytica]GAC03293.1 hypothetical protein GAGA_0428 [Paraglaciecola agarilytica NO2]